MISVLVPGMVVVAALAGVVLFVLGLRGRQLNTHPVCRGCRFDLVGLHPGSERCPECGATLIGSKKAVRIGARQRRTGLLIVSVPLLLIGLGGGGTLAWMSATSYNWYPHAPDWVLEAVAGLNDPVKQSSAVGELSTRLMAGTLGNERADRLIERGLEIQGDRSRAWVPEWGDLIEAGLGADRLSRAQFETYIARCFGSTLVIRDRVRTQESTRISISSWADRLGPATMLRAISSQPRVVADGREILRADAAARSGGMFRMHGSGSSSRSATIPLDPGQYTLSAEVEFEVTLVGSAAPVAAEPVRVRRTLSAGFEVVPFGTALVDLLADPSLAPAMQAAISLPKLEVLSEGEGVTSLSAQIEGTGLPMDFAFDVLVRDIKGELHHWQRTGLSTGGQQGMGFVGVLNARLGKTADVVLRASEEAALERTDLRASWGGEIVIKDVPVVRLVPVDE